MNRSKIEYCDHTLNIITGCRYKCEYCYARQMSRRFSGNVKMNIKQHDKYRMENGVFWMNRSSMKRGSRFFTRLDFSLHCTDTDTECWTS